jgi:hypothetical protein
MCFHWLTYREIRIHTSSVTQDCSQPGVKQALGASSRYRRERLNGTSVTPHGKARFFIVFSRRSIE